MYRVTLMGDTCLRVYLVDLEGMGKKHYRLAVEPGVETEGWTFGSIVRVPQDLVEYEVDMRPVISKDLRCTALLSAVCSDARSLLENITGAYVH